MSRSSRASTRRRSRARSSSATPRPARSCARAARRTPTAPRSTRQHWWTRPAVGDRRRRRARRRRGGLDRRASSTAWSCSTPTAASSAPALLWNDTRSARRPRDLIDEVGAEEFAAAHGRWCRSRRSRPRSCAGCATPSRECRAGRGGRAAARLADLAAARLRPGRAQSPLGPVLDELTTDRSDASGTAYWGAAGYDRDEQDD